MSAKFTRQVVDISNVAASKTAIIKLASNWRCHAFMFAHGYTSGTNTIAAACSNINEIRVKAGGSTQIELTGTQLRDYLLQFGTGYDCTGAPNTAPGVTFAIPFNEQWLQDEVFSDLLAWNPRVIGAIQIEIDFSTASTPTLVAWAVYSNDASPNVGDTGSGNGLVGQPLGIVTLENVNFAAAGTKFVWSDLTLSGALQSIMLYPDSGGNNALTPVTLFIDGVPLKDLTGTMNTALLLNCGFAPAASGRTANIYDLVIDVDGRVGSALDLTKVSKASLQIEAASAMSGAVTAIIKRLGPKLR